MRPEATQTTPLFVTALTNLEQLYELFGVMERERDYAITVEPDTSNGGVVITCNNFVPKSLNVSWDSRYQLLRRLAELIECDEINTTHWSCDDRSSSFYGDTTETFYCWRKQ